MQTSRRHHNDPRDAGTRDGERRPRANPSRLRTAAVACDNVLHGVGRSAFVLAPVLALLLLVGGLGYVRLRHGPVSLKFLVDPIERGIDAELDGSSVRIDDVVVSLSGRGGLEFRLRNLRMSESDGDVVASAPLAAVELSTSALWSGRIVPARVELIEPRLLLSYSDNAGLSLSFSKPIEPEGGDAGTDAAHPSDAPPIVVPHPVPAHAPAQQAGPLKRIDLARVVTTMSARARQRLDASSFLKEVGLRNAVVVLEYAGQSTEWHVPSLVVELAHASARSVIAGRATIVSGSRPWELTFETDEIEKSRTLNLKTSVRDLVPRSLATAVPQLSLLQAFDMPIGGTATMALSRDGDIRAATLSLDIGHGSMRLPALPEAPLEIDGGGINIAYDGDAQKLVIQPSALRWRGSHITLAGVFTGDSSNKDGHPVWSYDLKALDGAFGAEEFGVPSVALQSWNARGRILPHRGEIEFSEFVLKAGGATVSMKGDLVAGADPATTRIEGTISPMSLATMKALWPKAIAPGARTWVGERVMKADIQGGKFQFVSGDVPQPAPPQPPSDKPRLGFDLEARNIEMLVINKMPTVLVPKALVHVENDRLEIGLPEGNIALAPDHLVPLKDGRFTATDILGETPLGVIEFGSQAPIGSVFEVLRRSPLTVVNEIGLPTDGIEGKFDGAFKVTLPLLAELPMSAIKLEGKAHLADGRAKDLMGPYKVQGANIDLDITEKAVDTRGQMLINGVLAKVSWQRIFDAPTDKQPPLRITATLDDADRNQLGLDVNHIVQGDVAVELTVTRGERNEPSVRLRADLGNADLLLENVAWRKPPGRSAILQCDIVQGKTHKIELQNFKVAGDDVAIEGWAAIGADNRLREFYFPDFSLNVITRMEVQGELGADNIWRVKAHGPTFDGRDFFRSLFSLGQIAEEHTKAKQPREGIDLQAEIGTVIGYSEVSLRGVKLNLSKRGERLSALEVRGTVDGGKPLVVLLKDEKDQPRKLQADSTDAGQVFKLINFYPNIQGGRVRLEVNLDGSGPAEKTGTLWVESFRILGDPVVSEVFSGAEEGQPGVKKAPVKPQQVVRQVFDFDTMRVPFSVGYGQFVMEQSYLRGPLLGASIRGTVDFKMRRMNLGGTYVPLQGLTSGLCEIPIFGPIVVGPGCDGLAGITFAIQGPMENPDVVVNPFAMLAPGIFREIFQMTNPYPKIQRREPTPKPNDAGVRSSSATMDGGPKRKAEDGSDANADTVDGWSSTIDSQATKKKKKLQQEQQPPPE